MAVKKIKEYTSLKKYPLIFLYRYPTHSYESYFIHVFILQCWKVGSSRLTPINVNHTVRFENCLSFVHYFFFFFFYIYS